MLPAYRYMDSHAQPLPHQRNHVPCFQHYYPSWEGIPPHTKVDPTHSPLSFEPWPYCGSYGHVNPVGCHGCCNHSYPPGYYSFRPPYFHLQPPPQLCHHGPYHSYSETYPAYYVHPPHYSAEQPRYEYDKSMPASYCCGYPNRSCKQKEDKSVRIEEHEPEVEKKGSDSSDPVVEFKNYPYPIMWIPPEHVKNKESNEPDEIEPKAWNGWFPFDVKNKKEGNNLSESEPKVWNGWFPLDMNSIKSMKQDGDEKRNQNQLSEDKGQFPLPMIWLPAYDNPEEVEKKDLKETNGNPKTSEELPVKFKIIPVKLPENDDRGDKDKPGVVEDAFGSRVHSKVAEKEVEPKSIPVKHIEERGEKNTSEDNEKKISVKQTEKNGQTSSKKCVQRQSLSPPKASKLPPVCLRVDPLPRRKDGKGSSRSPSPPGLKEKAQQNSNAALNSPSPPAMKDKVHQGSNAQGHFLNKGEEVQPEQETRIVEVEERTMDQSKSVDARDWDQTQVPIKIHVVSNEKVSEKPVTEKAEICEREHKTGDKGATKAREKTSEEAKKEWKELSTTEAAILIQSAYRGHEIRKWEPLKKLRQIARVRKQVDEVRNWVQGLEFSADVRKDEKQRVVIGETIMSLLLQLDTIPGLHPSLRDIRKSVARDLVSLQEKLDSLTSQMAEGVKSIEVGEVSTVKTATAEIFETAHSNGCIPVESKEVEESKHAKNPFVPAGDSSSQLTEPSDELKGSEQQLFETYDSKVEKVVVPQLVYTEEQADSVKQPTESPKVGAEEPASKGDECVESLPLVGPKDEVNDEDQDNSSVVTMKTQKMNEVPKFKPEEADRLALMVDEKADSNMDESVVSPIEDKICNLDLEAESAVPELLDSSVVDEASDPEVLQLEELSVRVIDEELAISNSEETVKLKLGKYEEFVSQENAETKPGELPMLPLVVEESRLDGLVEVVKPEEPLPVLPLLEEKSHVEEPIEAQETYDVHSLLDVGTLSSESLGTMVSSQEGMELTAEETKEENTGRLIVENEAPDVEDLMTRQTGDHYCPCLGLEALDDISVELPNMEKEETKELEAVGDRDRLGDNPCGYEEVQEQVIMDSTPVIEELEETKELEAVGDKDTTGDNPCGSGVVQEQVLMDSTPVIAELADEKGDTSFAANVNWAPLDNSEMGRKEEKMLVEENEKLKEMLGKVIEVGKEQLTVISDLTGRIRDLERKLTRKRKLRMRRQRTANGSHCVKQANNLSKEKAVGCAV